jgi:hypothetical protein
MIFYDLSGGMESAAMLVIDRARIHPGVCVRYADTGKLRPRCASCIVPGNPFRQVNLCGPCRRQLGKTVTVDLRHRSDCKRPAKGGAP